MFLGWFQIILLENRPRGTVFNGHTTTDLPQFLLFRNETGSLIFIVDLLSLNEN